MDWSELEKKQIKQQDYLRLMDAVRDAGKIALNYFGNTLETKKKFDGSPVSEADLAVDAFLRERLFEQADQGYGWLSEESEDDRSRLKRSHVWIVDPIDGTRAFLNGNPEWTISAALVVNGVPAMGAVFNPVRDEFFEAVSDGGARLNDQPISVSHKKTMKEARIFARKTLPQKVNWPPIDPPPEFLWARSIAYRLCLVAKGWADAAISLSKSSDWDIAAAHLVVQQAQGRISTVGGEPINYNKLHTGHAGIVAAGPELHNILLDQSNVLCE